MRESGRYGQGTCDSVIYESWKDLWTGKRVDSRKLLWEPKKSICQETKERYKNRVLFFEKIQDWNFKSERIHFQSGFLGSFDAPWSERSWINLSTKETMIRMANNFIHHGRRACESRYLVYLLGSLSKTTTTSRMTPSKKINLYFTSEIRDCLHLFGSRIALRACLS